VPPRCAAVVATIKRRRIPSARRLAGNVGILDVVRSWF
jgi:hypothetical protein